MKKTYIKTYFRIDSGYVWGKGHSKEQNEKFNKEITEFLLNNDFKVEKLKHEHSCITGIREKENLYCHPMDLVGWIEKDNIQELNDSLTLDKWKTFSPTGTNTYDEGFDLSKKEIEKHLQDKKEQIGNKILELFKTKRRNLYRSTNELWDIIHEILKEVKAIDESLAKYETQKFITGMFGNLVKTGKIKESENPKIGKIYRTI